MNERSEIWLEVTHLLCVTKSKLPGDADISTFFAMFSDIWDRDSRYKDSYMLGGWDEGGLAGHYDFELIPRDEGLVFSVDINTLPKVLPTGVKKTIISRSTGRARTYVR